MRIFTSACILALCAAAAASQQKDQDDPLRYGEPVPSEAIAVIDGMTITLDEFYKELALQQTRPTGIGMAVVELLIDEHIIVQAMKREGIEVKQAEIQAEVESIAAQLRQGGRDLKEELEKNGVTIAAMEQKVRRVVALDKLIRARGTVASGKPVSNTYRKAWIADARKSFANRIVLPPARLPAGVVATVDGHEITAREFGEDILVKLDDQQILRVIEDILQEKLVVRMLAGRNMEITEEALLSEWRYRKDRFNADPRYKGVPYEEIVKQQTGLDPATLRTSLGFRVNTAVGMMATGWFTPAQLNDAYLRHKRRYGPRLACAHILIEATDVEIRQKTGVPSFAVAKARAEHVLGELEKGTHFAELARIWSKDRATSRKGGRLPTFTPERTVFEESIVQCAEDLQVGEISKPVRTASGWHLLKLLSRDPAPPPEDEGVQNDLRRFLATRLFTEAYKNAKIGVDFRRP